MGTAPPTTPLGGSVGALLTVEEAAHRLSIGRTTMYALLRAGAVRSVKVGRLRRIPAEALTEYIDRLITEHSAA